MDKSLAEAARELSANELYEIVRNNYAKVNHDYLQKQISVASEYLTDKQKTDLRNKGYIV